MAMNWINWIVGAHTSDKTELPERMSTREPPPEAPLIDSDETLVGEFTRARRYEQVLTIVVVSAVQDEGSHDGRPVSNGDAAAGTDVLPLLAAVGLREALRESDVLCYRPMEGRFVLGLPQSGGDEARQAMDRVGELFHRRLHIDLMAGAASFPADGLTLEDLENTALERAEAVGPHARSPGSGNVRSLRQVPLAKTRPRSRGRPSRAGAPSEIAKEALGSE
ncbi:MAG: hypothetical protein WEA34_01030 [Gemmatimonadota bacterium]